LTASNAARSASSANLVQASGDTIVVAPDANTGQRTACVFVKPAGGWTGTLTENARLTVSGLAVNDFFGGSLAVSGDTIVVGASDFLEATGPGSAYVFVKPVGGWTGTLNENARLTVSDGVQVTASDPGCGERRHHRGHK